MSELQYQELKNLYRKRLEIGLDNSLSETEKSERLNEGGINELISEWEEGCTLAESQKVMNEVIRELL